MEKHLRELAILAEKEQPEEGAFTDSVIMYARFSRSSRRLPLGRTESPVPAAAGATAWRFAVRRWT